MSFLAGSLGMAYLALTWCYRFWDPAAFAPLSERPLLLYSVAALLLGALMISNGLLAEMMAARRERDADHLLLIF
jgi:hypothetical protein